MSSNQYVPYYYRTVNKPSTYTTNLDEHIYILGCNKPRSRQLPLSLLLRAHSTNCSVTIGPNNRQTTNIQLLRPPRPPLFTLLHQQRSEWIVDPPFTSVRIFKLSEFPISFNIAASPSDSGLVRNRTRSSSSTPSDTSHLCLASTGRPS